MQNSKANDTSQSKSRQSISSHPVSGEAGEFHSNQAAPASSALSLEDAEEILRRVYQSAGIAPPENCSEILRRGSKHTRIQPHRNTVSKSNVLRMCRREIHFRNNLIYSSVKIFYANLSLDFNIIYVILNFIKHNMKGKLNWRLTRYHRGYSLQNRRMLLFSKILY